MKKEVTCHDKDGKLYKVKEADLVFRPSVYGLVIKQNKILLSRQWDGYDFPGGGIEITETIEEALKREVWEETGLRVEPYQLIEAASTFFYLTYKRKPINGVLLYYLCKFKSGKLSLKNIDADERRYIGEPEWIKLTEISKLKFYNGVNSVKLIRKAAAWQKKYGR